MRRLWIVKDLFSQIEITWAIVDQGHALESLHVLFNGPKITGVTLDHISVIASCCSSRSIVKLCPNLQFFILCGTVDSQIFISSMTKPKTYSSSTVRGEIHWSEDIVYCWFSPAAASTFRKFDLVMDGIEQLIKILVSSLHKLPSFENNHVDEPEDKVFFRIIKSIIDLGRVRNGAFLLPCTGGIRRAPPYFRRSIS